MKQWALVAAGLLVLAVAIIHPRAEEDRRGLPSETSVAEHLNPAHPGPSLDRRADPSRIGPTRQIDRQLLYLRVALMVLAVFVLISGRRRRRSGLSVRSPWRQSSVIGALALVLFASAYNFFIWQNSFGIHKYDLFHYYLNSKYFPELGYFDLYKCAVSALAADPNISLPPRIRIRNLRDINTKTFIVPSKLGDHCEGAFVPQRWEEFQKDVRWFHGVLGSEDIQRVLNDQGFNPSPVWTLLGRPITSLIPATDSTMWILGRLDLALLLGTFIAVRWAFGFEALCLVVLVWAANPMTRYAWMGDAFLRYGWFASGVIGVCLLRKERHLGAGVLLAVSSLLRVFPIFFVAGYGLASIRRRFRDGRFSQGFQPFVIGFAATSTILLIAAIPVSERGLGVYGEFSHNIIEWSKLTSKNAMGLKPLLTFTTKEAEREKVGDRWLPTMRTTQKLKDETFASRKLYYFAVTALFLVLLWRAAARASDWEAAAMGIVLTLLLTQAPSYYTGFLVAPTLLATRRPRIGIAMLVAMAALGVVSIYYQLERMEFLASSVILLLVSAYIFFELQFPPVSDDEPVPVEAPAGDARSS